DGRTGVLVQYGDEGALAGAVRELLMDAGRRKALGREAASYVVRERSLEAAAAKLGAAISAL
ncbi:MAG: glycosyltransferase family 1 protein, partial [Betaproteobacteria bacterium]|nr:glycosyltransferase family 1 protein [Betaproteobacteria bacterium]MBV9360337.1 glycosyltransferase family 1 protein [Betaproteobacteria bacterium]